MLTGPLIMIPQLTLKRQMMLQTSVIMLVYCFLQMGILFFYQVYDFILPVIIENVLAEQY